MLSCLLAQSLEVPPGMSWDLNTVIQGGSFALLAAVVLWVGRVLVPRIFAEHQRLMDQHRADLERKDERCERELAKRDAALEKVAVALEKVDTSLTRLDARVAGLEQRGGDVERITSVMDKALDAEVRQKKGN